MDRRTQLIQYTCFRHIRSFTPPDKTVVHKRTDPCNISVYLLRELPNFALRSLLEAPYFVRECRSHKNAVIITQKRTTAENYCRTGDKLRVLVIVSSAINSDILMYQT